MPNFAPPAAAPPEDDLDPTAIEASVLDEIMEYAQGKEAEGLKSAYAPPPPPPSEVGAEPIPGVPADAAAVEGAEGAGAEGDLTIEDLEALLAGAV